MRDYALRISIDEFTFWNMTIHEVNNAIEAWSWRREQDRKYTSFLAYRIPTLIAIAVMDGKKYPEIYEAFPDEYDEKEIKEQQRKYQIQKDMDVFKAWAEQFNKRQAERNE